LPEVATIERCASSLHCVPSVFSYFLVNLTETGYDNWRNLSLSGQGRYNAEIVVGTMSVSGGAAVTINTTRKNQGRVNQVFVVE
jgi:hypothetical protein